MNSCIFSGWLVADPEITMVGQKQTPKCTFRISVKRRTAQQGQPDADFFTIETWGKAAENCAKYLAKGRPVMVRGSIHTDSYVAQDGQKRYRTYLTADMDRGVEFLPSGSNQQQAQGETQAAEHAEAPASGGYTQVDMGDELPF